MSDSVALTRNAAGRVIATQRNKILKSLGKANISLTTKKVALKWLPSQVPVTSGSAIETALNNINARIPLW
jgi:hypothetical protein